MNALRITLCIASLATIAACAAAPGEEAGEDAVMGAEETGEDGSALVFAPGDHDIIWSGPATYGALWAKQVYHPYPAVYVAQAAGGANGVVHLSAATVCSF